MTKHEKDLWERIHRVRKTHSPPVDFRMASFGQQLAQPGVEAGELVAADKNQREITAHASIREGGCVVL